MQIDIKIIQNINEMIINMIKRPFINAAARYIFMNKLETQIDFSVVSYLVHNRNLKF